MEGHLIKNISDYVTWTETTAIYPRTNPEQAREYEVLGALSELGEICGMFKREIRDSDYTLERLQLKLELGDVAWYLARIHYNHLFEDDEGIIELLKGAGIPDPESYNCFVIAGLLFEHYQPIISSEAATIKAILGITHETHPKLEQVLEVVNTLQMNITEHDVKVIGHVLEMHSNYKSSIPRLLFKISQNIVSPDGLILFFMLVDKLRFEMLDIMRMNYTKLEDRKLRGALHGQGDAR